MSAIEKPLSVCASCGEEFADRSRTSPRSYCYECSPLPGAARREQLALVGAAIEGEPFTVPHFVRWARELVLDNGEFWVVEPFFCAYLEDFFAGFPETWLLVPEGNTKTTSEAGLALYHMEFTPYANALWAASARDQALLGYEQAEGFVLRSERLQALFKCHPGYRRIAHRSNGSRLQIFAADDRTGDGVIPTLAFLDELHRHRSMKLYRTWAGKLPKRGGQLATFSTAGVPGSEFEEVKEKIRATATEIHHEGSFTRAVSGGVVLHEWAVPKDSDVEDMAVVKEANPFSGITVEMLASKYRSPSMNAEHWRRFVCNWPQVPNGGLYITDEEWVALADAKSMIPEGAEVCLGMDGSRVFDTTVIGVASRADDVGTIHVDARVFSARTDTPYHVLHEGKIDMDDVEAFVIDRFDYFRVAEVAYDPRYLERSAEILEARLPEAAVAAVEPQSRHMRDALQTLHRLVGEGKIRHNGDAVIASHVANARVDRGSFDEIRRVVKLDQRKPIDAVIAIALAVWRMEQCQASAWPLEVIWV